jgi:hypothetical protein
VHACVMNRHAYVCTCGVNSHALVHSRGFKQSRLGGKFDGCKLIFLMLFMVHLAELGLLYVVAGEHCARCWLVGESGIGPSYEMPWLLRSQMYVRLWKPVGC